MMLETGVPALQTISLSFIFAGFSIITLSVCQALGHGFMGLVVSVVRQLVVLVPVAYSAFTHWGAVSNLVGFPYRRSGCRAASAAISSARFIARRLNR